MNCLKSKNKITSVDATEPLIVRSKHSKCLCSHPNINGDHVQPDGLQGGKCDEIHTSSSRNTSLDNRGLLFPHSKEYGADTLNPETIVVVKDSDSSENRACFDERKSVKECSFAPPQGMENGEFPKALFHQYYPNRNEGCTFDLLPLPFKEKLEYREMCRLSLDNEDVRNEWKEFLYKLPNSDFQTTTYPDDRFWRWIKYLRYRPNENKTEYRFKMQTGPKYDGMGRLPITGEDLHTFRGSKTKPTTEFEYFLKKGDGVRRNK